MTSADAASPLILTLVAGGFTIVGVALKIGYDSLAARRATKVAGLERFSAERRQAYEKFNDAVKKQLEASSALHALMERHQKEGKTEISEEEQTASLRLGWLIWSPP